MSDLVLMPDCETLVIDFLEDQDEVFELVADRIYSELPADKDFPLVRVHQFFDAQATSRQLWLIRYSLQIDVWGGPKKLARTVADTIRAALDSRIVGSHDEGIVSRFATRGLDTTADPEMPTDKGKARPRCRFDIDVWAHPAT